MINDRSVKLNDLYLNLGINLNLFRSRESNPNLLAHQAAKHEDRQAHCPLSSWPRLSRLCCYGMGKALVTNRRRVPCMSNVCPALEAPNAVNLRAIGEYTVYSVVGEIGIVTQQPFLNIFYRLGVDTVSGLRCRLG